MHLSQHLCVSWVQPFFVVSEANVYAGELWVLDPCVLLNIQ